MENGDFLRLFRYFPYFIYYFIILLVTSFWLAEKIYEWEGRHRFIISYLAARSADIKLINNHSRSLKSNLIRLMSVMVNKQRRLSGVWKGKALPLPFLNGECLRVFHRAKAKRKRKKGFPSETYAKKRRGEIETRKGFGRKSFFWIKLSLISSLSSSQIPLTILPSQNQ